MSTKMKKDRLAHFHKKLVEKRRQLEDVNSAIHEVETGQVKARLVFDLQ